MGEIISGGSPPNTDAVQERAAGAASGFRSLGVDRGDTVALYLRNDLAFFEASYAAGLIGAYPTPVNWHYTMDEVRYLIQDSGARVVLVHADLAKLIPPTLSKTATVLVVGVPP